jgi:aspartokinase/homoserine dehydrogenase 1
MVVSALYKVTDMLDNIVTLATQGKAEESRKELHKVRDHHLERARRLFGESKEVYDEYAAMLNRDCETIPSILSAVVLSRRRVSFVPDVVMGHGEIWSMRLLHGYMRANAAKLNIKPEGVITIDARDVLTLKRSSEFETALTELDISRRKVNLDAIDLETSQRLLDERLAANPNAEILIIPGFVCRSYEGSPTTLGRNASDFSAAIFGYLLDVTGIFIWKEEDGVFTADPRVLGKDNIHLVSFMSYHEVAELANFGGKVLHGSTMEPALKKRIPIHLRSTYNLEHSGMFVACACNGLVRLTVAPWPCQVRASAATRAIFPSTRSRPCRASTCP